MYWTMPSFVGNWVTSSSLSSATREHTVSLAVQGDRELHLAPVVAQYWIVPKSGPPSSVYWYASDVPRLQRLYGSLKVANVDSRMGVVATVTETRGGKRGEIVRRMLLLYVSFGLVRSNMWEVRNTYK
jgi:hypothetical protein